MRLGFRRSMQTFFCVAMLASVMDALSAESSKRRQAAILARMLSYELTLDERAGTSVGIAVVYKRGEPDSERNANDWFQALSELSSLKIRDKPFFAVKVAYNPTDLVSAIEHQGVDVLLVATGVANESEAIARLTRSKRVLSASSEVSLVERGLTACVSEEGGKLKVVINLNAAEREGIRFSSNLLKLAKIVR